ncbi:fimbria/pilus outer membrane usher protein [Pseudomonas citronellolis]|uniref:fimbria/pilus outer membrane usher protein n=1 Tax=Pseudomonas citronellolis TaxID=53408 RepID=UPI0023E3B4DA|nr:fimbria/pilus outer membrane usher protein [Pseudomonas citronellolis]MDF3931448.1 fimbrial biogenesis outer membrane usher protein [Pseudomonas citronellolis]
MPFIGYAVFAGFGVLFGAIAEAAEGESEGYAQFNQDFLRGADGKPVDLSRFEQGNPPASGSYRVDVYVNRNWVGRQELSVRAETQGAAPRYCFKRSQLAGLGLNTGKLPDPKAAKRLLEDADCVELDKLVPEARVDFDLAELRADLSIPQAYLSRAERGYVDPQDWDRGITAGFVDYNTNAFRTDVAGNVRNQYYAGFNGGLNLGDWRLRHNGSYSRSSGDGGPATSQYDAISSYAQRDVTALKSQLTLGEYYTPSDLFDSVPYTGVQLASDERMLPDSQRGFAPAIRGTAETNARVTVRQAGNLLYETTVAPGPFVIDDLHGTGYAGDLEVTVSESDGRVKSFTVPFANVAQLLRPGTSRYNVVAGRYRDEQLSSQPHFVQGTYQRGMSNLWTGYGGSIVAENYLAVQGGLALSTSVGAFAFDVTHSRAKGLPETQELAGASSGQSYRISYSKLLESTRTNFVVAGYRFSSDGYLGFGDYVQALDDSHGSRAFRQRSRVQANINQPLGDSLGSFYLSGSTQNYWNTGKSGDSSFQAGYSNSFNWGSFNLSAGRTRSPGGESDTQYMLTVSIPLGSSPRAPYLSSSVSRGGNGDLSSQVGVSGSLGERSQFGYSVHGSRSSGNGATSTSTGANAQYRASKTSLSASVSNGEDSRQLGAGMSGSVLVHGGGVNFSQDQGETKALVEAAGAEGAAVLNSNGGKVGGNGYAVVTGLTPYRHNAVALDPKGMSEEVELQLTEQSVAPRHGSVVLLKYPTVTGKPVLLTLRDEQGQALPVGAEVLDAKGGSLTLVGQGSRVFLRSEAQRGRILVRWGEGAARECQADYQLPAARSDSTAPFLQAEALCVKREVARR